MSVQAEDPKEKYAFLKKPIPAADDGVTCIVIHEKAHTEFGRLLSFSANVPFAIYGKHNPKTLSGEWDTFKSAIEDLTQPKMIEWVSIYDNYAINEIDLERGQKTLVSNWYLYRFMQNWYLKQLLLECKLPMVFVRKETITDTDGTKYYQPIESYEFLLREVRNYRYQELRKLKNVKEKENKRQYKRELRSGLNPENPSRRKPKR